MQKVRLFCHSDMFLCPFWIVNGYVIVCHVRLYWMSRFQLQRWVVKDISVHSFSALQPIVSCHWSDLYCTVTTQTAWHSTTAKCTALCAVDSIWAVMIRGNVSELFCAVLFIAVTRCTHVLQGLLPAHLGFSAFACISYVGCFRFWHVFSLLWVGVSVPAQLIAWLSEMTRCVSSAT